MDDIGCVTEPIQAVSERIQKGIFSCLRLLFSPISFWQKQFYKSLTQNPDHASVLHQVCMQAKTKKKQKKPKQEYQGLGLDYNGLNLEINLYWHQNMSWRDKE